MKKILTALLALVFCIGTTAFAVKVPGLYTAEFPVSTQADSERVQVVKQGLVQVLVRVSGNPDIAMNPAVSDVLKRSNYYVQEYNYSLPTPTASLYDLKIHYSKDDINRLLRKANIPYLGEIRPLILVWLVAPDQHHGVEILNNASTEDLLTVMKQQAKIYGLPLIFPVMDMDEIDEVSVQDVKAGSLSTLQTASKRYAPDALLVGEVESENDTWQGHWQLILGENSWKWAVVSKTPENLFAGLFNQMSQALAKTYVVKKTKESQNWLKIEVINITDPNELNMLTRYLKQLPPVIDVQLSQVAGEDVELSVLVRGTITTFLKQAAIDHKLVLKSQNEMNDRLVYEWVH